MVQVSFQCKGAVFLHITVRMEPLLPVLSFLEKVKDTGDKTGTTLLCQLPGQLARV